MWSVLSVMIAAYLAGCSWEAQEPTIPTETSIAPAVQVQKLTANARAANLAKSLIGTPYRYGGATADGFDCSGLIYYVYAQSSVALPRTAAQQQRFVRNIPLRDAQPGDLLFFNLRSKSDHVGIYVGNGAFVHSPSTGKSVQRITLKNAYFRDRLISVGRVSLP